MADDNFATASARRRAQRERQRSTLVPPTDNTNTVQEEDLQSSADSAVLERNPSRDNQTAQEIIENDDYKKVGAKIYRYPLNVEQYEQPHSVTFRIKVREKSKAGQRYVSENSNVQFDESNRNRLNDEELNNLIGVATALGGATAGNLIARSLTKEGNNRWANIAIETGGTFLGGITGFVGGKLVGDAFDGNRLVKTNSFITLYVPQSPQVNYGAQWQESDIGALTRLLALNPGGEGDIIDILMGSGEFSVRTLAGLADLPKALGVNVDFRGAIQAASGKVENPNKEQLFKSMNFRNFTFEYKFAPRNLTELQATYKIINEFKKNMHPEKDPSGLFLLYPSEFDVEFRYRNSVNQWLHKIKSCALADLRLTFGNGGTFTAIKGTDGAPSEITMTLVFKELEVLTRDDIGGDENGKGGF